MGVQLRGVRSPPLLQRPTRFWNEYAPASPPNAPPNAPPSASTRTGLTGDTGDYCTALIMSKMGRYIATTIPPTTTPSTTIISGSSSDSSALTAASTSLS